MGWRELKDGTIQSDGCTKSPDFQFRSCCTLHDFAYYKGGSKADRKNADVAMRKCIQRKGRELGKPHYWALSWVYYSAVRVAGASHFRYKDERGFYTKIVGGFQRTRSQNVNQKNTPSFTSSSFIIMALSQAVTLYLAWSNMIPGTIAAYVAAAAAGAYIISRGLGKIGAQYDSSLKKPWQRSEFYVVLIVAGQTVVSGLSGAIPADKMAMIATALSSLYALSTQLAKVGNPVADLTGRTVGQVLADAKNNTTALLLFIIVSLGSFTACVTVAKPQEIPTPVDTFITGPSGTLYREKALPLMLEQKVIDQEQHDARMVEYDAVRKLVIISRTKKVAQ